MKENQFSTNSYIKTTGLTFVLLLLSPIVIEVGGYASVTIWLLPIVLSHYYFKTKQKRYIYSSIGCLVFAMLGVPVMRGIILSN